MKKIITAIVAIFLFNSCTKIENKQNINELKISEVVGKYEGKLRGRTAFPRNNKKADTTETYYYNQKMEIININNNYIIKIKKKLYLPEDTSYFYYSLIKIDINKYRFIVDIDKAIIFPIIFVKDKIQIDTWYWNETCWNEYYYNGSKQ